MGGTATKKRSKENASPQSVLSVPSVQTTAFGSRVERCSQNHGHLKPSFSRIPTSPRFATSALGQVRWPADQYGLTHVRGWLQSYLVHSNFRYKFQARSTRAARDAPSFFPVTGAEATDLQVHS